MKDKLLYFSRLAMLPVILLSGLLAVAAPIFAQNSKPLLSNIAFETTHDLVFVRTRVNDSAPLWFILDSGASISVVSEKTVRTLGLKPGRKNKINAIGGMIDYSLIKNIKLDASGATLLNQTVAAIDLSVLEPKFGRSIDGILGSEFFYRYVVKIDYAGRTLDLYEPKDFQYSGMGETIEFEIERNTPFIRAALSANGADSVEGSFLIDTGALAPLYLNKPFAEQHNLLRALEKTIPDPFTTHLGGELSGRVGRMKKMRVGNFTAENADAHFFDPGEAESGSSTSTRDGIIGGGFFKKFAIILDYRRKHLILEPHENFSAPFKFNQSGLDLAATGADYKTIKIKKVLNDSPASEAGLRAADVILSIDGKQMQELSLDQLEEMFSQIGREYDLIILRDTETIKTKIKLRELI